jgi:prepilin-type N-terminal cleavage/methylation domain-containing protein
MQMRTGSMIRLRSLLAREAGFTLAEVMVTAMIMSIVVAVFFGVLSSVQQGTSRQDFLSRANDQARLAIEELDREIRSGNVLYDPAQEASYSSLPVGYTLRIYTQTNATTRQPNPGYLCALWTINDQNQLVKNMWPPMNPDQATGWRVVAEGVVNRVVSPPVTAFALDPDPSKGGRTVDITLVVNPDPTNGFSRTVKVQTSSTGRNTSYGFPADVCAETPS